jgi:eukaryotic-like serine/threonine-protein kinase
MVDDAASHEPGVVLPGTLYLVDRGLGRGGMGTVYDTTDIATGERYAVKVLSTRFAGRKDLEERILREAAVLGALEHPNIVRVFRTGYLTTGVPFYVMERLEGQTLRDLLRCRGPLAPSFACDLVGQVLAALGVVHDAGLVHRDVKPENLFRRTDGTCVVLDFGLVKVLTDMLRLGPKTFDTGPGQAPGTYHYMAPESVDGRGEPLVHLVDIFAVGVVLIELLTGRLPLEGAPRDVYLTYLARRGFPHRYDGPPGPRVPDVLRPVVERATARNPSDRFPSARAFADALARACRRGGFERPIASPGSAAGSFGPAPALPAPPASTVPRRLVSGQFVVGAVSGIALSSAVSAFAAWLSSAPALERVVDEPRPAGLAAAAKAPSPLPPPVEASPAGANAPSLSPPSAEASPASARAPSVSPPQAEASSAGAPSPAPPPRAAASARRVDGRAQLKAKLEGGQTALDAARDAARLCQRAGDTTCLKRTREIVDPWEER